MKTVIANQFQLDFRDSYITLYLIEIQFFNGKMDLNNSESKDVDE